MTQRGNFKSSAFSECCWAILTSLLHKEKPFFYLKKVIDSPIKSEYKHNQPLLTQMYKRSYVT